MSRRKTILKGTLILTATGLITRFMGFFYRIFLSHTFGEAGVGLYQLIFPVYALGLSLTSIGIELALSRCVSRYTALSNNKRARDLLYASLFLSIIFSLIVMLLIQKYSYLLARHFLHNQDTEKLLLLLSYIFPFASIHSCIIGYYLGLKSTKIPAVSQLIEQFFRITFVFLFYKLSSILHFPYGISFSVLGLIIGEIASSFYCIKAITGKLFHVNFPSLSLKDLSSCCTELIRISFPVTASRVSLNLLQSVESISIPLSLQAYGFSIKESLSTYGVLTGMALPCILFPSAITNAVSTMLLPTVSEIQAVNDHNLLKKILQKTMISCTLLGSISCFSFILAGNIIGDILFHSQLAGKFIITLAWICPFLYSNNTLLSIINGIGKTNISFLINIMNLAIRISCVIFVIPLSGIYGYLLGLLLSQFFVYLCSYIYLYRHLKAKVFH